VTTFGKIWGMTEPLICTPMFELHRLHIRPMMRCSLHVHQFKHNAFYILEGALYIDAVMSAVVRPPNSEPVQEAFLVANDYFTIAPGVHHQFRTGEEACVCLECYYTEPLSEDIIRRNVGGPA